MSVHDCWTKADFKDYWKFEEILSERQGICQFDLNLWFRKGNNFVADCKELTCINDIENIFDC